MSEEDFEAAYEAGKCQCGDETLDWDWEDEEMAFTAQCPCFKKYTMKLTKCLVEVESESEHGHEE